MADGMNVGGGGASGLSLFRFIEEPPVLLQRQTQVAFGTMAAMVRAYGRQRSTAGGLEDSQTAQQTSNAADDLENLPLPFRMAGATSTPPRWYRPTQYNPDGTVAGGWKRLND